MLVEKEYVLQSCIFIKFLFEGKSIVIESFFFLLKEPIRFQYSNEHHSVLIN